MSNPIVHVAVARLSAKERKDRTAPVKLRITFGENGKTQQRYIFLNAEHHCKKEQWSVKKQRFNRYFPNFIDHNELLEQKILRARRILRENELQEIIFDYTQFVNQFLDKENTVKLVDLIQDEVNQCKKEDRPSSAKSYSAVKSAINSFSKATVLSAVNDNWLSDFVSFLRTENKNSENTIHTYMAELGHIFRKSMSQKLIKNNPFSSFEMPPKSQENVEKAISEENLRVLISLKSTQIEQIVKDIPKKYPTLFRMTGIMQQQQQKIRLEISTAWHFFLFCFFCRGINFTDAALLNRANVQGNRITVERHKTSKRVSKIRKMIILKTKPVEKVIDFLGNTEGVLLFSIVVNEKNSKQTYTEQRKQIDAKMYAYNACLAAVCKHLDIPRVTVGAARHTYATLLQSKYKHETALVSYALDHRTVTSHYISDKIMQEKLFELDKLIADDFGKFMDF